MTQDKNTDLTRGPILKKLLLVAIPIMGMQFMQMAYNLTDMFWLGRMADGTGAVAASGLSGMFLWLSMALSYFGRTGAEIGVSQSLGRSDEGASLGYARQAFTLALALGAAYALFVCTLARPLLSLFRVDEELLGSATTYLRVTGAGVPLTYVSAALTGVFNASGNSRLSFWANAVGLLVNMVLDPLLILSLDMGVYGAALATLIAQAVSCALFVLFALRHPARPFPKFRLIARPDWGVLRDIWRWSWPVALESAMFTLLAMAVTRRVSDFGAGPIAVQKIGGQIEALGWLIGGGFASAVTAFVGQNYGARRWARIREGYRVSFRIMAVWGVFITALLFFCGEALFSLFSRDAGVVRLGADYLRIYSACQLMMCLESACSGVFRGVGKTLPPSACSIFSNVVRVPLVYWLSYTSLGLDGIWVGVAISAVLRGLLIVLWYALFARGMPRVDDLGALPQAPPGAMPLDPPV